MHSLWTRKTRTWGYEVIRGIDEDDPWRVIRAFRRPTGLAFVDLNNQVEIDYGGYAWTQWMHRHFGDTALHIALKWKRHRAVKAILSLRPNWTIPNEAGITAEQLVLRLYGKSMARFKDEQEREYEDDAMRAEEEAMRNLMAAEQAARDKARLDFLEAQHAARTIGIDHEAAVLLGYGRVVTTDGVKSNGHNCHRHHPHVAADNTDPSSPSDTSRAADSSGWVKHVCRELRRNRFAAHLGEMRRNVVPARAPPRVPASAGVPPLSPTTTAASVGNGASARTTAKKKALRSPTTPKSVGTPSRRGTKRRERKPHTAESRSPGRHGKGHDNDGDDDGGALLFDSSSAVGAGRWPCADDATEAWATDAGRDRSTPPSRSVSPLRVKLRRGPGGDAISSPTNTDGGEASRSAWGGGKTSVSPKRFDRSSRMSNIRTTRILAAGKSVRRPTPEDRLRRKMEARAAASAAAATARSTPSPAAATAGEATAPPPTALLTASPTRSRLLPAGAAAVVVKGQSGSAASVTTVEAAAARPSSTEDDEGATKTKFMGGAASREEPHAATAASGRSSERGGGVSVTAGEDEARGGDAIGGGTRREGGGAANGGGMSPGKTGSGGATIEGSVSELGRGRSAPTNEDSSRGDHRQDCGRTHGLSRQETRAKDTINESDAAMGGDAGARGPSEPHSADGDNKRLLRPSKPGAEEALLRGLREGPLRDALAALLTSTLMGQDGGRVLAPSFPSISAMCELKYSEPIGPPQASAVERAILARPGVLLRLSLAGKRIGDRGAMALAPALAAVRSVDLRSNNIGDVGTTAIASALREAAATVRLDGPAAGANQTKSSLCVLESLSLAGNRIEDAGAAALSDMLEAQDENDKGSIVNRHSRGRNETSAPELFPSLAWLSVAGNPGISGDARERLLQAGANRQEMRRRTSSGSENQQPSMVVIA